MNGLRFWVLGPLRVTSATGPLALGGPRQRAVLALLLAHPVRGLATAELVDGVWGEAPPPSAERTLHAYVARLRSILEPERGADRISRLLLRTATGYRVEVNSDQLDSLTFEQAVATARRQLAAGDIDAAAVALRAAVGRWHGPAFADLLEFPAIQAAGQRLEQLRADAIVDSVEADLVLGRHETLIPDLQNLVTASPFDERLWAALALAYYRCGLQADALGAIRKARQVLAEQLGIDPGRGLRDLQGAILAGDPRLDAPTVTGFTNRDHPGLEGRGPALATLRHAWARAAAGHGGGVIVSGPTGIGRSRLLQAFGAEVRAALGNVVVLETGDPATIPTPAELARVVGAAGTGCLFLVDDLDRAGTVAWVSIGRLLDAAADHPVLLLVSVREDHIAPELAALLGRLDPGAGRAVQLTPLEPADVARIAAAYVGPRLALEAAAAVAASARGVPALVHHQVETWARERQLATVSRGVVTTSADWSGARQGEAELVADLRSLADVDAAATTARVLSSGPPVCPYPALTPYSASGAAFFAGREELIARATARLAVTRTLTLIGPSGAGKSSLVRAGLIPALTSGAIRGSETWQVELTTPSSGRAVTATGPDCVLIVDQLEELVTLRPRAVRDQLVARMRACVRDGGRLVQVIRSDQYASLSAQPELSGLIDSALLQVPAMSDAQLGRAIDVPVVRAGGWCESELTQALVRDLSGQAGALPLLSTTMARLWEMCPSGVLTLDAYAQTGGVRESVAQLAEGAYQLLDTSEQQLARTLLLRMAASGHDGSTVRALVPLSELDPASRTVLDQLAHARLLTVEDGQASVSHEAVFTNWPRLADWLAADADARASRARLSRVTRTWVEGGRLSSDLLRGPRLEAATELATHQPEMLTSDELALVEASAAASDQERRGLEQRAERTRRANRRLLSLLAASVALLLVASGASLVAARARQQAAQEATAATARSLGALSLSAGRLDLALLLAAQAANLDPSPATRGDLLSVAARALGATHVLTGTGQRVLNIAVGGPGPEVVALDRTGRASVYDVTSGKQLTAPGLAGLPSSSVLLSAAFSPDGTLLVLGAAVGAPQSRGLLLFLDPKTLAANRSPEEWTAPVTAVGFAGGNRLAVLTGDGLVHLLRKDGTPTAAAFPSGAQFPSGVQADRSGRWLLTEGPTRVWDLATRHALSLPGGYPGTVSFDGSLVAVANGERVRILDRRTGRVLQELEGHAANVEDVRFSPDDSELATSSDEGAVIVWSVRTGQRLETLNGHAGRVNAVAFSPDGRTLVTGGFDGRIVTWNISAVAAPVGTRGVIASIPADVLGQSYLAMSANTDRILIGEPSGTVVVAKGSNGAQLALVGQAQPGGVYDAELSRDGRLGATVGADRSIRVWDLLRAQPFAALPVLRTSTIPASVALSPDDKTLAWGDLSGGVSLVSLSDGRTLWHRTLDRADPAGGGHGAVTILAFSPDGHTIGASGSHVATYLLPASGDGPPRALHAADDNTSAYAFSPDGTTLVTTDTDGTAWRWALRTGARTELGTAEANAASSDIFGVAYDPTGDTVATWAQDGSVQLWDAQTSQAIGPAMASPAAGPVMTASWHGDDRLVTLQADGVPRTLSVSTTTLVARACAVAGRALTREEWARYAPGIEYTPGCSPH